MTGPMSEWNALLEESAALTEGLVTPVENLFDTLERYDMLLDRNLITQETWSRAVSKAFEEASDSAEGSMDEMSTFADQAARNMQDSFAEFLFDPFKGGVDGMVEGFVTALRRMAAEQAAANLFEKFGLNNFVGNVLGSVGLGGPKKLASGGSLGGGQLAMVGEQGPELFVPRSAGTVVPNNALGGFTVNVNVSGNDLPAAKQSASQVGYDVARSMNLALRRNG